METGKCLDLGVLSLKAITVTLGSIEKLGDLPQGRIVQAQRLSKSIQEA